MKLIHSITLNDLPSHFKLSNKAQAKFYNFPHVLKIDREKIPKKYRGSDYGFKAPDPSKPLVSLYHKATKTRVIKNANGVGKPRLKPIAGQMLFNTSGDAFQTNKCLDQIKEWFWTYWTKEEFWKYKENFVKTESIYPLTLQFIYRSPRSQMQDLDNFRILYEKAIIDALQFWKLERKTNKDKFEKVYNDVGILPSDTVDTVARISSEWKMSETIELQLNIYAE